MFMAFWFGAKENNKISCNANKRTIHHKKLCYETEGNCFLNVLILNPKVFLEHEVCMDWTLFYRKNRAKKNCNFSQMKIEIKSFCSTRHTPTSSHSMNEKSLRIVMRRNQYLITMFLCSNNCRSFILIVRIVHRTEQNTEFICCITNYREKLEV